MLVILWWVCVIVMASEKITSELCMTVYHSGQQKGGLHRKKGKKAKGSKLRKFYSGIHHMHCRNCNFVWWKVTTKASLGKWTSAECWVLVSRPGCESLLQDQMWGLPAFGRAQHGPGALPSHPLSFLHPFTQTYSQPSSNSPPFNFSVL